MINIVKAGTIGIISDTHGLLREEALQALQGSDLILHAGDIGDPSIIQELGRIAPVVPVRGNCDKGDWALAYRETQDLLWEKIRIFLIHNRHEMRIDPKEAGYNLVVFGHSHHPAIEENKGVTYVNPGSAGPRRFKLPTTVATVKLDKGDLQISIVPLK